VENVKLCSRAWSWALWGALALVFASVIAFGSYREVNRGATVFEHRAQLAFDKINSAADIIEGVLVSLGVSAGTRAQFGQTDVVAQAVLSNYRFVMAMGRFAQVNAGSRRSLEDSLRQSTDGGFWEFEDQQGDNLAIVPATSRPQHFPVVYAVGRQGSMRGLTGLDLASEPALRKALGDALASDQSSLLRVVSSLSAGGQLWVIGGAASAGTVGSGGHWVELDLLNMVKADSEWPGTATASIDLLARSFEFDESVADPVRLLDTNVGAAKDGQLELPFLQPHQWTGVFDVGGHTLRATFSQQPHISWQGLAISVVMATLSSLLLWTVFVLNMRRRAAVRIQQAQVAKLHKAQQQASVTLASISDTVITIDNKGKIVYANAAASDLLKQPADDIVNHPIHDVLRLSDDRRDRQHPDGKPVAPEFLTNQQSSSEYNLERTDGQQVPVSQTNSPLHDINGKRAGNVLVLRDISVERELTAALQHQANHDPLTGIANRHKFEHVMAELFQPDAESTYGHALCYIDLDQFKLVNDTCGHAAGDELLVDLVAGLRRTVREHDLMARLGGDEFAIVIRDCSLKSAEKVVQRIYAYFQSSYFKHTETVFPVRASIGYVHFKPDETTLKNLMLVADAACYDAKRLGRNQVCQRSLHDEMALTAPAELSIAAVQRAVDAGNFRLVIDEVASTQDRGLLGTAFSLELETDSGDVYDASEISAVAERHGLTGRIDQWIVGQSISNFVEDHSRNTDLLMFTLSAATLSDVDVLKSIKRIASEKTIYPNRICVVVPEESLLKYPQQMKDALTRLHLEGYRIAVSCFGAGISSISTVATIPINYIEIDYEQCGDYLDDQASIAKLIVSMQGVAEALDAELILRNADDDSTLALCRQLGVNWMRRASQFDSAVWPEIRKIA
jgi:diguanylate cyclase (GGDEF)-like protein/PAS domain S-box-containing protein